LSVAGGCAMIRVAVGRETPSRELLKHKSTLKARFESVRTVGLTPNGSDD